MWFFMIQKDQTSDVNRYSLGKCLAVAVLFATAFPDSEPAEEATADAVLSRQVVWTIEEDLEMQKETVFAAAPSDSPPVWLVYLNSSR